MAALIEGITVRLYEKTKSGEDAFKHPIYTENAVCVRNVLVTPLSSDDVIKDMQLYGKKAVYQLSIPKGDRHTWEDRTVEFYGERWKTFGFCQQLISNLVPLNWDREIRVERYG